jgi:predicted DNA binding CopG/RHH family protein
MGNKTTSENTPLKKKAGRPKLYPNGYGQITLSLPVEAIEAVKQFARAEALKYATVKTQPVSR